MTEREQIVAWLRDGDGEAAETLALAVSSEHRKQRENGEFHEQPIFDLFAEAIERGDFIKDKNDG